MNHVIRTRASPLKVLYCRQSEANGSAEPCRTCRQLQSTLLSPASSTGPRKYSLQCIPCMHQVLQCSGRPFYLSVRHPNDGIRKDGTRTTARHMLVLPPWSFPEWTFFFSPSRNSHLTFSRSHEADANVQGCFPQPSLAYLFRDIYISLPREAGTFSSSNSGSGSNEEHM